MNWNFESLNWILKRISSCYVTFTIMTWNIGGVRKMFTLLSAREDVIMWWRQTDTDGLPLLQAMNKLKQCGWPLKNIFVRKLCWNLFDAVYCVGNSTHNGEKIIRIRISDDTSNQYTERNTRMIFRTPTEILKIKNFKPNSRKLCGARKCTMNFSATFRSPNFVDLECLLKVVRYFCKLNMIYYETCSFRTPTSISKIKNLSLENMVPENLLMKFFQKRNSKSKLCRPGTF